MRGQQSIPDYRRAGCRDTSGLIVLLVAALLAVGLTGSIAPQPARAAQTGSATGAVGIVVRHGDGRLRYAYVPLMGDRITGAEALQRAGFALNIQSSGGLGVAVCKIDGEGCDALREGCFCRSYGDPAFYWHYYLRAADGTWRTANTGAGNRVLRHGDVDGWSWTAGASNLPPVTLDEIAVLVHAAEPPAMPPPPAVISPVVPAPATPPPSVPSPRPPDLATDAAMLPAPPLPAVTATTALSPTTAMPAMPTPGGAIPPRAVAVGPDGTVTPLQPTPPTTAPPLRETGGIGAFVAVVAAMLLLVAAVPHVARRRRR